MNWDIDIGFINGMMVGLEFPSLMEIDDRVTFCMAIDLLIVRIVFVRFQ